MAIVSRETIWLDRMAVMIGAIHNFILFVILSQRMQKHKRKMNLKARSPTTSRKKRLFIANGGDVRGDVMNGFALVCILLNSLLSAVRTPGS